MFKEIKKIVSVSFVVLISQFTFAQANDECAEMEPLCTDSGLNFTANATGGNVLVTQPGNNYGCLGYSPNPAFFFLEIATSGNVNMNLTAAQDIDFIIWGPFTNLAAAQAQCGNMGNGGAGGSVIDCSYSGTNNEFPDINGAVAGQVYVMLITNYAATVQDITLTQVGGTGSTDCDIVVPDPCLSDPGTYTVTKNGAITSSPIYLCAGQSFAINSNGDYILPNDTIPIAQGGDGVYSSQLMWLVYNAPPTNADPDSDLAFLDFIIPTDDIADVNNGTSPIVTNFGCGTYYFVPVAGDDGIGGNNNIANGINDNGGLDWDKNSNGCYLLGTPVQVTYACPIQTNATLDCNPPTTINGMDIQITGGSGSYVVVNQGQGDLVSTSVPNGGTANVNNLENNQGWDIDITDAQGCTASANGLFVAPVINNVTITPATSCPLGADGTVNVTVAGTSGNGAPYTILMAGDPPTIGTTDSYSDIAGTLVNIIVADDEGCISDSTVTITSMSHFINVQVVALTGESCYGDNSGSATISAVPTPSGNVTQITWTGPSGQHPGGDPGGPGNTSQSGMEPGNWSVTILDDTDCEVTIPVVITAPQELDIYLSNSNEPTCYQFSDGSITVSSTGGSGGLQYSWSHNSSLVSNTANNLTSNTYWAYVTDANGCEDSLEIILGQPDSLYATFIIKDILCYGDSSGAIIVEDVFNEVGTVTYNWNLQGVLPNPPTSSPVAGGLPIGTYLVTIQDQFCSNLYEFTLTQNSPIVITDSIQVAHCRVFPYQSGHGVLSASATGGVPDYDYFWTNLQTGATHIPTTWGGLNPGAYMMTVTDDAGCIETLTVQLDSVSPIADFNVISAELDINLTGTAVVCAEFENQSQYFSNPNHPLTDTTFFWEMGYNLPYQISKNYFEVFDTCYYSEGEYEVCLVAKNENNCLDTACKILTIYDFPVLIAPNVFTPGGDGINEYFQFDSLQVAIVDFECVVYDRWGKEMFVFSGISDGWDGNAKNGKPCTDGVYFYTYRARSTNGTDFEGQGTVHLIRAK